MEATQFNGVYNFEVSNERKEPVKTERIFIAAVTANLSAIAVGSSLGWFEPIIDKLQSGDSPLSNQLELEDFSWIGVITVIGAIITPFIAGPLAAIVGRKKTLLSSSIFFIIAYIVLFFASKIWMIVLARLIKGFGIGFVMSVVPMYVGEIATDNVRGALVSLMPLFIGFGIFGIQCIGPFVSYNVLQCICIAVSIVFSIAFFFAPESPYFLVGKGKRNEALEALKLLRGQSNEALKTELSRIETMVETSMSQRGIFIDILTKAHNRKALIVCLGLIIFQHLCGSNAVVICSNMILYDIGLDNSIANIIINAMEVVSAGLLLLIADRIDRKILLLSSAFCMGICLALLGCISFAEIVFDYKIKLFAIPVMILYLIMFGVGFGSVPWIILSEMFEPKIKTIAFSMVVSLCWIAEFFVSLFYPVFLFDYIYYGFWLFALLCGAAFFFTMFVVLETRGLSLQEIQNRLNKK